MRAHCLAAVFGLSADLKRHEHTMHKQLTASKNKTFKCTVPGSLHRRRSLTAKTTSSGMWSDVRDPAANGKGRTLTPG
ncbi:hypothetical protein EJ02DRAFT_226559 [Clathrospora elynae]|uniref:Uncharacterized protein n=1 Tax=Clathrospora elynae TaxID=706981 RepID=A0A6A5SIZ9_9PLEO|nr:hypothetical protein EJ02DRAFT_226559 [Clathrospora elynae]